MNPEDRPYLFRCGEYDPDAKSVAEWDREYTSRRETPDEPWFPPDWMVCPACIRFRFSPVHLVRRYVTGICDGRNGR